MLKYYIRSTEALKQLRSDFRGVVSFEYVIVAACVVAAVASCLVLLLVLGRWYQDALCKPRW